jgi:phage tail P2-like protein
MAELTQRLSLLPVDGLLVDLVDLVSAPFLPHLAEQFHVLGLEGWSTGLAEADQRELVRNAIRLHRKKGTPWAVRTALASIGYPGSELIEYKTYREEWEAAGAALSTARGPLTAPLCSLLLLARSAGWP